MPTASGHTKAIRATKIIGAEVRNSGGEAVGKVEDVVLDKMSNGIMFAVVRMGGVTTTSNSYHPLPWSSLDYDEEQESYIVPYSKAEISKGPSVSELAELTAEDGAKVQAATNAHYKAGGSKNGASDTAT